jgi:hypothetical protein
MIKIENIQDLNTMSNKQKKKFIKLLNDELSKPENKKIIDEIKEKVNNKESFKS